MKLSPRYDGPPIVSIAGAPADQLAPLVRERRRLQEMLAGLHEADWDAPTRCDEWAVRDVVAHLISVNNYWQMSVLAGLGGAPTRVLDGFDPAATPPLIVAPMRAAPPAEMLGQFTSSNDGFLGAIADLDSTGWTTVAESPAGHVPIRLLAAHALWDFWIHERDIGLPLGLPVPVETDEVLSCLRYAAALSPAFLITGGTAPSGAFAIEASAPAAQLVVEVGNSVAVRDGNAPDGAPCLRGDAVVLTEALSIRAPLPESAPPEWRQLLEGLAVAFDTEPANT